MKVFALPHLFRSAAPAILVVTAMVFTTAALAAPTISTNQERSVEDIANALPNTQTQVEKAVAPAAASSSTHAAMPIVGVISKSSPLSSTTWPGGIAVLPVPAQTISATYRGRRLLLFAGHAYIGISLAETPGPREVEFVAQGVTHKATLQIRPKDYSEQHLTLKNPRMVNPTATDLVRIAREQNILDAARAHFAAQAPDAMQLWKPTEGPLSSSFGSRRILNGEARNPHSGLDIAAAAGAPVLTPAPGRVSVVGDFFFTGSTVLIDHGMGFLTLYAHLSQVDVKQGDVLTTGQRLGRVGATGRATGPHLHWAVYLNGVAVDPALLVIDALPPAPAISRSDERG